MYRALKIAKYILNKCIDLNRPISNLQLQKILYYVQDEYINKTYGEILFEDDIVAWTYGPSVPNVYYEYNKYSSSDILDKQDNIELEQFEKNIIDPIIIEKSMYSSWSLVEMSQSEEPWINAFNKYEGSPINVNDLKR